MVLFPESRPAVAAHASEQSVTAPGYDIAAAREQAREAALAAERESVTEVLDVDAGGVPARLYRPWDAAPGVVVHLHGGGFVFNDVEVHDPSARRLANRTGMAVLSVDYRRPPEHPFPAAPDDVDTVLSWLDREGADLCLLGPVHAHGDSAGANLALVAAMRHPGRFAAVALVYPFLDPSGSFDSYREVSDAFDADEAAWYWQQYAATPDDLTHPDLAPLGPDLTGDPRLAALPPTIVVTCEHDPLRDEGEHLARLLAESGVEVVATRYLGQVHGIWRHPDAFPSAEPMLRQVAGFLRLHS